MRYIKLFEQNWWENAKDFGLKIPTTNIKGLCVVRSGSINHYIAEEIVDDHIHLYKNYSGGGDYTIGNGGWELAEKEDYIKNDARFHVNVNGWQSYTWQTLPQEIKDKLK